MKIKYTIEFHGYWHCGSGLAAGADVDALVIRDKNKLPYIPGKTMKGLIREATNELLFLSQGEQCRENEDYFKVFGYFEDDKEKMHKSESFFSNATLNEAEAQAIINQNLQRFMSTSVSQTAINEETGSASRHSLRKTEVIVPCILEGEIQEVPDTIADTLLDALALIKRLGVGRNRGLGRCTIKGRKEE